METAAPESAKKQPRKTAPAGKRLEQTRKRIERDGAQRRVLAASDLCALFKRALLRADPSRTKVMFSADFDGALQVLVHDYLYDLLDSVKVTLRAHGGTQMYAEQIRAVRVVRGENVPEFVESEEDGAESRWRSVSAIQRGADDEPFKKKVKAAENGHAEPKKKAKKAKKAKKPAESEESSEEDED